MPLKVNRNIIGALLTYSAKSGKVIDFEKALMNPLSPISLSISKRDRTRCMTSKSKLLQCIKPVHNGTVLSPKNMITGYIIALMALIRTLKDIPTTFEELIWKIVKTLPSGYKSMKHRNIYREFRARKIWLFVKSFYEFIKYYGFPKI